MNAHPTIRLTPTPYARVRSVAAVILRAHRPSASTARAAAVARRGAPATARAPPASFGEACRAGNVRICEGAGISCGEPRDVLHLRPRELRRRAALPARLRVGTGGGSEAG